MLPTTTAPTSNNSINSVLEQEVQQLELMEANQQAADREFDPKYEWQENAASFVLRLHLSGFRKEDFRVQVDGAGRLTVRGQRADAAGKNIRFHKVFQLPLPASNLDDISGRFDAGVLSITVPKRPAPPPPATTIEDIIRKQATKEEEKAKPKEEDKVDATTKTTTTPTQVQGKDDDEAKKAAAEQHTAEEINKKKAAAEQQHKEEIINRKTEEDARKKAAVEKIKEEVEAKKKAAAEKIKEEVEARKKAAADKIKEEVEAKKKAAAEKIKEEVEAKKKAAEEAERHKKKQSATACGGWKERVAGELQGLKSSEWAEGVLGTVKKNKEVIAAAVTAFSLGLFVASRLSSRH